jgi:dTDP-4-dehydrorhamnose 3,5-epimerase
MLDGVRLFELKKFIDERGSFTEVMRADWEVLLENDSIMQTNLSVNHPGVVKAWHKHERGQIDYFFVLGGTVKICVYDEEMKELNEIVSSGEKLQLVRVPGRYWHGFKVVGNKQSVLIYFTNKLYDRTNPDEIKIPWNDQKIVPKIINGKINDPRCNKPWDWLYLPNR